MRDISAQSILIYREPNVRFVNDVKLFLDVTDVNPCCSELKKEKTTLRKLTRFGCNQIKRRLY